jgi:hypothetical protein
VRDSSRRARAAANIIPQTFDPGGKSANVDCFDADVAAAAKSAMVTTVFNKGEVCFAGIRVFVQRSVYDEFTDTVQRLVSRVTQGDPTDPGAALGAQSTRAHYERVLSYIDPGRSEGAGALTGGKPARIRGFDNGLFIEPTSSPTWNVLRTLMSCIRSNFLANSTSVGPTAMALALLTQTSIPPNRSTAVSTARRTSSSRSSRHASPTAGRGLVAGVFDGRYRGVHGAAQARVGFRRLGEQHDVRAVAGRCDRDRQPDPAAGAGDHEGAVVEHCGLVRHVSFVPQEAVLAFSFFASTLFIDG